MLQVCLLAVNRRFMETALQWCLPSVAQSVACESLVFVCLLVLGPLKIIQSMKNGQRGHTSKSVQWSSVFLHIIWERSGMSRVYWKSLVETFQCWGYMHPDTHEGIHTIWTEQLACPDGATHTAQTQANVSFTDSVTLSLRVCCQYPMTSFYWIINKVTGC